jgi:hypothetical protein
MSRDLVVHYKRKTYLVKPTADSRALAGSKRQVEVHESADGRVEIRHDEHLLPYELFDREAHIAQGEIVENKRLGAALAAIQATHEHRDAARLASKKLTLREKARIVEARLEANLPPAPRLAGSNGGGVPVAVAEYIARFSEEQRLKAQTPERRQQRAQAATAGSGRPAARDEPGPLPLAPPGRFDSRGVLGELAVLDPASALSGPGTYAARAKSLSRTRTFQLGRRPDISSLLTQTLGAPSPGPTPAGHALSLRHLSRRCRRGHAHLVAPVSSVARWSCRARGSCSSTTSSAIPPSW